MRMNSWRQNITHWSQIRDCLLDENEFTERMLHTGPRSRTTCWMRMNSERENITHWSQIRDYLLDENEFTERECCTLVPDKGLLDG